MSFRWATQQRKFVSWQQIEPRNKESLFFDNKLMWSLAKQVWAKTWKFYFLTTYSTNQKKPNQECLKKYILSPFHTHSHSCSVSILYLFHLHSHTCSASILYPFANMFPVRIFLSGTVSWPFAKPHNLKNLFSFNSWPFAIEKLQNIHSWWWRLCYLRDSIKAIHVTVYMQEWHNLPRPCRGGEGECEIS